ncbi:MAG: hypothetical protein U0531_17035 [Dehalococcoidia bacterium]
MRFNRKAALTVAVALTAVAFAASTPLLPPVAMAQTTRYGSPIPSGTTISATGGQYGVYTVRLDGADLRRLDQTAYMRNHVHVKGTRMLFTEYTRDTDGNGRADEYDLDASQTAIMNLDRTGYQALPKLGSYEIVPVWSPDGNSVLFASDRNNYKGYLDLFVHDLRTGTVRNLTNTWDAIEGDPHWLGTKIVFNRVQRDGTAKLWIMNQDGSGARQLTNPSFSSRSTGMYPFGDFDPKLSPDGKSVVFERHIDDNYTYAGMPVGNWDLYVVDVSSGRTRLLAGGAGVDVVPTWSPDGKTIAYWQVAPDHASLFTVAAAGGTPKRVFAARPDLHAEMPDWYVEAGETRLVFSGFTPQ